MTNKKSVSAFFTESSTEDKRNKIKKSWQSSKINRYSLKTFLFKVKKDIINN